MINDHQMQWIKTELNILKITNIASVSFLYCFVQSRDLCVAVMMDILSFKDLAYSFRRDIEKCFKKGDITEYLHVKQRANLYELDNFYYDFVYTDS